MPNIDSHAKSIFLAAIESYSADQWPVYLDGACGDDQALRAEVERLLTAHRSLGTFHESPASAVVETFITAEPQAAAGTRIGPYKIREQLGEGGMGVVYVAEQTEPVRRKVALKIIKPGMDSKEVIARFEAERQALAMMSHPHIAQVLDGGTTDTGRPYFVMELVKGIPMTKFCDEQKLTMRERLELFVTVCQAVQHAHLKGIIHRDLKPSNVLVELHDVTAIPKVIDFGIAKATNQQLTQQTVYTQFSQLIGTPLYMSPEQAQLSGLDVDTRSDVYSLGVMLYELLTGTTPFDESRLSSVGLDEMRRIIREDEPARPSHKVSTLDNELATTISDRRQTNARSLSLSMQRELDWIVMKALEKDRTRRYESASDLAQDIERYLRDEPVQACPPTVGYLLKKYAKKNRVLLTSASVIAAMLLVSTVVSTLFAFQANEARAASQQSEQDAIAAQGKAETAQAQAEQERANAVAARQQSDENFAAALGAIDKLLQHASSPEFQEAPHLQPIRQKMMDDVMSFYEKSTATIGDSLQLRHRAAITWMNLGILSDELGNADKARECHDEALEQIESLVAEFPDNVNYRKSMLDVLMNIGFFYGAEPVPADFDRALQYFERVRKEVATLRQQSRNDQMSQDEELDLARREMSAFHGSTFIAAKAGDEDARQQFARQGYEVANKYGLTGTDVAGIEESMALIERTRNPEAAAGHFRRSIEARNLIIQQHSTRQNKILLAKLLGDAGRFFKDRDKTLAIEYLQRGAELAEQNYAEFPSIDIYGSLMWSIIIQLLEAEDSLSDSDVRDKYKRYDQYLLQTPRSIWHFRHRITSQFRLQNYSQVVTDIKAAAQQNPEWRSLIVWISPREIAACPNAEFQAGILKLADEFVAAVPDSIETRGNRAWLLLAMGQVDRALADLTFIASREDSAFSAHYQLALAAASLEDHATYQQTCRQMVTASAVSENPLETHFVSWTAALAPDALDDYESAIRLAQFAVAKEPDNQQYLAGLGAILMRAGKYHDAKTQLQHALDATASKTTSPGYIHYFLALTESALGNPAAAQAALATANELAEAELSGRPSWNRRLTLELLRKEALR